MTPRAADRTLADAGARRLAATRFDANVVVVAGAGTGKTALLVERALNLIGSGHSGVDRLALITFTEKAAAELRVRLARGLDRLRHLAGHPATEIDSSQDADRSWEFLRRQGFAPDAIRRQALQALRDLDTASIGTLHSFCADILRRHPREARVDPGFGIDEGAAEQRLFDETWQRHLEAELGQGGTATEAWRRALGRSDGVLAARRLAASLARFTYPEEALTPASAPAAGDLLGGEAAALLRDLRELLGRASGFPAAMETLLNGAVGLLESYQSGGLEAARSIAGPRSLDALAAVNVPTPGKNLRGAESAEMEAMARRVLRFLKALRQIDEPAVTALLEVARHPALLGRERFLAQGLMSFDGLLRLTARLLQRVPTIRRQVSDRYSQLLVDEFQDTDPLQYEILFFLAEADGKPAADAYSTRLQPGRLFIVGDPKQSIYRFRGADMAAYRRAVDHILAQAGQEVTLSVSFRSPQALLDPINRLFSGWIGAPGAGADHEPEYAPISAATPADTTAEPAVEIWSVAAEGNVRNRLGAEGRAVAAFIAGYVAGPAPAGEERRYSDVAVLLRALTHSGLYADALRRAGIPFVVDGGKDFSERPEVGDLLSFLRAVQSPNDGPAMLALFRSPLGAVPDGEAAAFVRAGGRIDRVSGGLGDLSPFPSVRRVFALVQEFRDRTRGLAVDEVVRRALTEVPLRLLHAATWQGAQRLANLDKLQALAERHARDGLSLAEAIEAIDLDFESARDAGDSPLADETINAVRLLSIHKAKGLEYKVVLVPDVGREAGQQTLWPDLRVALLRGTDGGQIAVRLPDGRSNAAWMQHEMDERRHAEAEEKRVFYVACTRARNRLILINSQTKKKAPWRDRLAALGYHLGPARFPPDGPLDSASVRHRLVPDRPIEAAVPPTPAIDEATAAAAAAHSAAAEAAASCRPPLAWPSGTRPEDQFRPDEMSRPDEADGARHGGEEARRIARLAGMAVHAALERWAGTVPLVASALAELGRREAMRHVESAGIEAASRPALQRAVLAETGEILEGFLASPLPARLARAEILGAELPVLFKDDSTQCYTGACDLIFREGDVVVVADYKTDRVDGNAPALAGRYEEQMRIYREAVGRGMPGSRVRAEILFVRTGEAIVSGVGMSGARQGGQTVERRAPVE